MTSTSKPFRSLATLGVWLQGLLAANAAFSILVLLLDDVLSDESIEKIGNADAPLAEVLTALAGIAAVLIGLVGVVFATFVVWLVWMNRAAHNLRALRPNAPFHYTPGWTVGWWFIPFANLVHPYRAMVEIWRGSDPDTIRGENASDWMTSEVPQVFVGWWAFWIISSVYDRVTARMETMSFGLEVVGALIGVVSAVLAIIVVRAVTARQQAAFERVGEGPRVADGIGHVAEPYRPAP